VFALFSSIIISQQIKLKMCTKFFNISLLCFCLIAFSGCGKNNRPADLPKLTPCQLTIQYEDGTPVSEATVMLFPLEGKWYCNGVTDSQGVVNVKTNGSFAGAASGSYKVTVKKQKIDYPPGFDPNSENENKPEATVTNFVAEEFMSMKTTPLTLSVADIPVRETLKVKKAK
jgi:hypothetical protein